MKHYLLNHQPQKGLQAACAQQGQAPTCNARGKGHTPASPKTLTRILLVLLTMLLLPSAGWGQTDYPITVAGVQVTDANSTNITGSNITSGTVSFDASTNTLTLDNAQVNGTVTTSLTELNVHLKGHSVFYVETDGSNYYYLFNGGQTLNLNYSAESIGDVLEGIGTTNDYKLESSKTSTTTTTYDGPSGSWFDRYSQLDSKCYCKVSKPYLWVVGDEVDKSNISNFTTEIDGFSFDGEHSLTMKKIVHEDNGAFIVKSNLAVLDVYIADDIRYNLNNSTGKVFVYTGTDDSSTLTLNIAEGKKLWALWNIGTENTGSTDWICEGFKRTNYYTELSSAINNNGIYAEEDHVSGEYSISFSHVELYDLSVAGNRVNSINAADILGDQSSSVSFTPAEGTTPATLTLNNANITVSGNNAIESGLENLTVNLVGGDNDNVITCQGNTDCVFKGTKSGAKVTFTRDATTPGLLTGSVSQESNMFVGIDPIFQNGLNYRREGDYFYIDTKVGLTIGDTEITSANIGSDGTITGISAISSGTVKFTPADNTTMPATPATLTLDNANFGPSLSGIVWSGNGTLKIQYSGNNIINTRSVSGQNSGSSDGYCIFGNASSNLILSASDQASTLTLTPSYGGSTESNSRAAISGFSSVSLDDSWGMYYTKNYAPASAGSLTAGEEVIIIKGTPLGLSVAGVVVTSENRTNILGDGKVSFSPAEVVSDQPTTGSNTSATLTLDGATIEGNIQSSISPLIVHLKGSSTITPSNTDDAPFQYAGTAANGSLTFESSEADNGELTLGGTFSKEETGESEEKYFQFSSGNYTYSNSICPSYVRTDYQYNRHTYTYWGVKDENKIFYNAHYGITIGDYEVTKFNKENVTGSTGDFAYYPDGNYLIVPDNNSLSSYEIKSHRAELNIQIKGDCAVKAIKFDDSKTDEFGTLDSKVLNIDRSSSSTPGQNTLTVNTGTDDPAISGFTAVNISENLHFDVPETAPSAGESYPSKVVLSDEEFYDLWVGSTHVSSRNASDILGVVDESFNQPTAVFDGTNTLTLTNASITVTDKNAIESGIENLTVNLVGRENIITCQGTNDVAFKAVGSGSKITFTTTSEYEAVSLYISGGISPIEGLDTDYENGLGFLYSSTDQRYSVETLETPEIKKTAETEDGITVALVLPSGDKYSSNTTMYYKITYSDSDETTGFSEYSNAFTMTKPGTVTAYLVPLGGQSANAVAKYFGYPDAPYTLAVGDEITPAIYPAIDSNDGIEQSGASSGNEDIASFTYSDGVAKAIGIGNTTLTATFTASDQPFTILNIDPEGQTPNEFTATFSVIVGGSLSEVFEGSNEFGSFYNTSETTYAVPEGMKAYVITGVNGDKVITTETTVLPPNTVVLMDKGEGKAFTYIPATSGSAPTGNLLKRATSDVAVNTSSKLFVLYNDEYVKATAGSPIPAGKNYLDLSGVTAAGTRGFYYIEGGDDGTTVIREVRSGEAGSEKTADGGWHDLQGRKLTTKPAKGLYIRNGKKVVVK